MIPRKLRFHPHIDSFISPNVEPLLNSLYLDTVKKQKKRGAGGGGVDPFSGLVFCRKIKEQTV